MSTSTLTEIDIFWFKRDLRLEDNPALWEAAKSPRKLLLVYLYEPAIWKDPHYDKRHLNFVLESLTDLNRTLGEIDVRILTVSTEVIPFFESLSKHFTIHTIYSTEETGLDITYSRDIAFSKYCLKQGYHWKEFQNNGVVRGLQNRNDWRKLWYGYMNQPIANVAWEKANCFSTQETDRLAEHFEVFPIEITPQDFQKGGRSAGLKWKKSFFDTRIEYYSKYISKPEKARFGCSRLSPYFAWGNLSIREVFQEAKKLKKSSSHKRQLNAFLSRLRWQSHFIQKFEMEPRMEFEAINKGFLGLEQPLNQDYVNRWKAGRTGYPLVDAAMRCVAQTGYINFRMRAMVTSFLTHHLFQHFTTGGPWLARQFLDFEPGIHYGQMQMQAGFTGTNTVRVYNPVKNAQDHDPEAVFIKKYVPELASLPVNLALEPWTITPLEAQLYQFNYGTDYPKRIVDIDLTRKVALQNLYGRRKSDLARTERERILETHIIPGKRPNA